MANKLFQQLNGMNTQNVGNNNIKGFANMFKMMRNPQSAIDVMIQQNPQLNNVMKEIKNGNGNAKDMFYAKAKEMGIDPNVILNMLK